MQSATLFLRILTASVLCLAAALALFLGGALWLTPSALEAPRLDRVAEEARCAERIRTAASSVHEGRSSCHVTGVSTNGCGRSLRAFTVELDLVDEGGRTVGSTAHTALSTRPGERVDWSQEVFCEPGVHATRTRATRVVF